MSVAAFEWCRCCSSGLTDMFILAKVGVGAGGAIGCELDMKQNVKGFGFVGLALAVVTVLSAVTVADIRRDVWMDVPQPHRAVYDLSLDYATPASSVTGLEGRMVVEWRGGPKCDGYTSEQRVVTRTYDDEGGSSLSDVRLNAWEALDGNEFRFDRAEYLDGQLATHENGIAKRKGGKVALVLSDGAAVELPGNVLFPNAFNLALTNAIAKGHISIGHPIFDGAQQSASIVTAFIGRDEAAPKDVRGVAIKHLGTGAPLAQLKARRVHVSYFDINDNARGSLSDSVPSFEMDYSVFPNGVFSALRFFYEDAVIKGELSDIEYFKPGSC